MSEEIDRIWYVARMLGDELDSNPLERLASAVAHLADYVKTLESRIASYRPRIVSPW